MGLQPQNNSDFFNERKSQIKALYEVCADNVFDDYAFFRMKAYNRYLEGLFSSELEALNSLLTHSPTYVVAVLPVVSLPYDRLCFSPIILASKLPR